MRTLNGQIVNNTISVYQIVTFTICVGSYSAAWLRIRQVSKSSGSWTTRQEKCIRQARIMAIFVAVYAVQWWPGVVVPWWGLFAPVPEVLMFITVIFINIEGMFNCVPYTVIRKKYSSIHPDLPQHGT